MQARKFIVYVVVAALVLAMSGLAYAGWANPELLLDAKDVKKNIDKSDWVVLDCRDLKDYAKGHIPGAISLGKR